MTPAPDSSPSARPALDRRTLERIAVGAPPPSPAPSVRAVPRGARVRRGWGLRRTLIARYSAPQHADGSGVPPVGGGSPELRVSATDTRVSTENARSGPSPAPAVTIGRSRLTERPGPDSAFDPLYLLIPGDGSRSSGRAAAAALIAARRFSVGRPVVLLDLDPSGGHLQELVGRQEGEGLAEALEFGLSLQAAGFPLESNVRFVPSGRLPAKGLGALFVHAGWQRLLDGARRRGIRLLAYVPPDENLPGLASLASAAILLATPDEELKLHARLPGGLKIVGAIEPPPALSPQPRGSSGRDGLHAQPDQDTGLETDPLAGSVPEPTNRPAGAGPSVTTSPGDGSFASVFKALTADLDVPESEAGRSRPDSPYRRQKDPEPTRPGESDPEASRREGGPGNATSVDEGSDPAIRAATPEVEAPPAAPTARGLTLPEWLEAARARIETIREPSRSLARPLARLDRGPAGPDDAPGSDSFLAALETVEARLASVEAGGGDQAVASTETVLQVGEADAGTAAAPSSVDIRRTLSGRERFVRVTAVGILAYWTLYILWRWGFTLNPEALWFSVPVALAETWGWVSAILVGVIAWRLNHRPSPVASPSDVPVDVFVLARDEPLEVIRRAAASASALRYPHRTWIVDTVGRTEIEAMAGELRTNQPEPGYFPPADANGDVAAALNHALEGTTGQFVLTLDADHAVRPDALDALLGHLDDPRVAYVQTPPDVSEVDPIGLGMDDEIHRIREERRLAASLLQPGRDAHDCAILSPGCTILRRSAIAEAGGFSTNEGSDMLETSLRLHAAGWKSVYIGESLTYGLGGRSAASLNREREDRASGTVRTFRRSNPVTTPGLKLAQRFSYFHALTEPVAGVQKLILYLTPAVFFFTGFLPVRALDARFLAFFIPYLVLSVVYYEVLSRGLVHTWLAQRSQMTTFWAYTKALANFLGRGSGRTPAGRRDSAEESLKAFRPQVILVVVIALSIGWAAWAMMSGWIDYGGGWESLAVQLNLGWAAATIVLALWVIRRGLRLQRPGHRGNSRPHLVIGMEPLLGGVAGESRLALMDDISPSGLSFRSVSRFPAGTELNLDLPLRTGDLRVRGVVAQVRPGSGPPAFVHGVEFRDLPLNAREAIEESCRQTEALTGERSSGGAFPADLERRSGSTGGRMIRLPTWVMVDDASEASDDLGPEHHVAILEAVAPGGAALIYHDALEPGTPVIFEVPGSDLRGEGSAIYSRMLETPGGIRFLVGIRTLEGETPDPPKADTATEIGRAAGPTSH